MPATERNLPLAIDQSDSDSDCFCNGEPCDGDGGCASPVAAPTPQFALPSLRGRRILLATDGLPASDGATRMVWELANLHGARVEMLHVVDTRPAPIPPPLDVMLGITNDETRARTTDDQLRALKWRASHIVDAPVDWEPRIILGTPARTIAKEAEAIDAALIVMGLRHYGRLDRASNDETTLSTIRAAGRPVLAVVSEADALPTRALVAMDFSPSSVGAARHTPAMLRPNGKVTLAYVPPLGGYLPEDGEYIIHEMGLAAAFERYAWELRHGHVSVDHVVLHHEMRQSIATLLAEYAGSMHAGLIAVGSVGHGRFERWLLGSVSQDLIRDARFSLLVVPVDASQQRGDAAH